MEEEVKAKIYDLFISLSEEINEEDLMIYIINLNKI